MDFPNPVLLDVAYPPADGDVPTFDAATGTWRAGAGTGITFPVARLTLAPNPSGHAGDIQPYIREDYPYDPSGLSLGNIQRVVTCPPTVIGAAGTVVSGPLAQIDNIDLTHDGYDLNSWLMVTNMAGTQVLVMNASGFIPESGPGASGAIDWSTATQVAKVGSDLTWVGSGTPHISSTAGGIFVASMTFNGGWD